MVIFGLSLFDMNGGVFVLSLSVLLLSSVLFVESCKAMWAAYLFLCA